MVVSSFLFFLHFVAVFCLQVKDSWQERELIFVPYGTKTKLIKGWEDLFQLIEDQLSALQSMKMSPYFKASTRPAVGLSEGYLLTLLRGVWSILVAISKPRMYASM